MAAIRDTFFLECEEQLAELENGLLSIQTDEAGPDTVNAVFRAVHSIKGGGGAFGLEELVRFAHVFETTLDDVRAGRLVVDAVNIRTMLHAADILADLVRLARDGSASDQTRVAACVAELNRLTNHGGAAGSEDLGNATTVDDFADEFSFEPVQISLEEPEANWVIQFAPRAEMYANANETVLIFQELGRLGSLTVEVNTTALPDLAALDPEGSYLSWTLHLQGGCDETAIRDVFEWVASDCELTVSAGPLPTSLTSDDSETATAAAPAGAMPDVAELLRRALAPAAELPTADMVPSTVTEAAPVKPAQPTIAPPASAGATKASEMAPTIRVDLIRVDRLIDLVGELVINEAMLNQRVLEAGATRAPGMAEALDSLSQLTREIQDSVMAIRAQPVRSVFQRMPRLVREVASMTGKSVRLMTEGENTEVDKTVIERLSDPLTHMIRNAIDHGLETPEKRLAAGKPEEGLVTLTALHRSGRIVIEVADDGAGLDRDRIRTKAIERAVISADANLTDEEVDNLIFMPGFSTAASVSDISGRGVGLDVVKRSVQALGGRISIASVPGKGSTFTLSLPLTLAVLDGMVVSVSGHTLIVPLGPILETLQPTASQLHALGQSGRVIALRGSYIPVIDVGVALGYRDKESCTERVVALLVEGEYGDRAVLQVDEIQGQRQIVIKSLEANYGSVPGIAAATVMGDGRVALIVDVDAVLAESRADVLTARHDTMAAELSFSGVQ